MNITELPEFALGSILIHLPLPFLFSDFLLICPKLSRYISRNLEFLLTLADLHLSFDLKKDMPLAMMLSDLTRSQEGLLALRGYFTDGGIMRNWGRFCFHNMFEYSGTVYSTNRKSKLVSIKAYFLGHFGTDLFGVRTNEDLEWKRRGRVPLQYQSNELLDRCVPNEKSRYLPGFNTLCKTDMEGHACMADITIQEEVPPLSKAAVVSRVAICRPGMATGPVKTLAIYTSVSSDPWTDLPSPPTTLDSLLCQFPSASIHTESGWHYAELSVASGPWLWVQFTEVEKSRVFIDVGRPRCLSRVMVVMVDRDDRREEFQMFLKTMEIGYVCLFGKVVRFA